MSVPICGCCGSTECNQCDSAFPIPPSLKTDLGGPYTCNNGGSNPCAFTMGGVYVMKSPDVHLGWGECHWTYKQQMCNPIGAPQPGFLTLHFFFSTSGAPFRVFLDVLANYIGFSSSAGYRLDLPGTPPHNCLALFSGGGLTLPRVSLGGSLCIPNFPTSLSVHV